MNRRSFVKLSGQLVAGAASSGILSVASYGCMFRKKLHRVSETRMAMGTFVTMTLMHTSRDEAEEVIGRVVEEIDRLAGLMDRFDESTAVARLNREGVIEDAPPEVIEVISRGLYHHQLTGGSFDISVKPVVDLFEEKMGRGKEVLPTEKELREALALVDSNQIEIEGAANLLGYGQRPGIEISEGKGCGHNRKGYERRYMHVNEGKEERHTQDGCRGTNLL